MTSLVAFTVAAVVVSIGGIRTGRRLRHTLEPPPAPRKSARSSSRRGRRGRRTPSPIPSALLLELIAALLEAGAPPPTALRHLANALARVGDHRATHLEALAVDVEQGVIVAGPNASHVRNPRAPARGGLRPRRRTGRRRRRSRDVPFDSGSADPELDILREAMRMAGRAGLAPASLVRRAAAEERRRTGVARRRSIRRLEVLLVLPVGLCLLPAFVLLGIVPVVIDLFSG
jgi:hypothetical protein